MEDGKYPFMASLYNPPGSPSPERHFCGGTLIDSDSVLTAAHCVRGRSPSDTRVAVGRTVLTDDNQGHVHRVSRIYEHPKFEDFPTNKYDVAVLKLDAVVPGGANPSNRRTRPTIASKTPVAS